MTQISQAWGSGPGADYEAVAARFRPLFEQIAAGAVTRELQRDLPVAELASLREAGFMALRVPREFGGAGLDLPQYFNLLIELAQADSNLVQAIRGHAGFVENVLNAHNKDFRLRWLKRLGSEHAFVGPAWTEPGQATQEVFATRVVKKDGRYELNGRKFYTTGALYADWIEVGCSNEQGEAASAIIKRDATGVKIDDDWQGFGQRLTASGTAHFSNVPVEEGDVTLAVRERKRNFSHANAALARHDPQILQQVGQLRSAAYAAGAIVLKNAEALQRAQDTRFGKDAAAEDEANAIAELEVSQAQSVVISLILNSATGLFDALGASATFRESALDRFWRNARTISSHNPRVYKDRIVGDFAVNEVWPPYQWRIGVA